MITKENFTDVFNLISKEDIETVFNSNDDFICLQLYCFNADSFAELNTINPNSTEAEEMQNNGALICDKDQFLQLVTESKTTNQFLIELI